MDARLVLIVDVVGRQARLRSSMAGRSSHDPVTDSGGGLGRAARDPLNWAFGKGSACVCSPVYNWVIRASSKLRDALFKGGNIWSSHPRRILGIPIRAVQTQIFHWLISGIMIRRSELGA
jgi:hypothetical protein